MAIPTSFWDVWKAIRASIEGLTITANSKELTLPVSFFNTQPELRNTDEGKVKDFEIPTITLRTMAPNLGDIVVNEPLNVALDVDAQVCYLDGMLDTTIALADGQTLIVRWGAQHGLDYVVTDSVVTFHTSDFVDITHATLNEVAMALMDQLDSMGAPLHVRVVPGSGSIPRHLRIENTIASGYGSLEILLTSTATALLQTFPAGEVAGRTAGNQIFQVMPPEYYDFHFRLVTRSKRADHHMFVTKVVEQLFKISGSPNQRAITIDGSPFAVQRFAAFDDPIPAQGVFITTSQFTLKNVPVIGSDVKDTFLGGLGNTGASPPVTTFELRIAHPVAMEELPDIPPDQFEVVLATVPPLAPTYIGV